MDGRPWATNFFAMARLWNVLPETSVRTEEVTITKIQGANEVQ
jgi:hypothetical protein